MNTIRPQLERAKDAYLAEHYPGDLAADVMARAGVSVQRPRPSRFKIGVAVVSALAAMVAVAVYVVPRDTSRGTVATHSLPPVVTPVTHSASATTSPADTTPDMTSVLAVATGSDDDVSFVPGAPAADDNSISFGFSVPSFPSAPSWDGSDSNGTNKSTTQEAS